MFRSSINKWLLAGVDTAASVVRPIMNRVVMRQATDIRLELQRRALASTVDYVQAHMAEVRPFSSRYELLTSAFAQADTSHNRLICEFGVFTGATINHLAKLTSKTVFGFDSFEGLPEDWRAVGIKKGHFAVKRLPAVRENVTLVKGWFHKTIPSFLAAHDGAVGFLHIDCDLYSSTKVVFDLLGPRLSAGTVLVFDEYLNFPEWQEGEHKAFNEFLTRTGLSAKFIGYLGKSQQVAAVLQ